jgi:peptidoglycan hydrolase-like protein with peptidoglycan-binding domain
VDERVEWNNLLPVGTVLTVAQPSGGDPSEPPATVIYVDNVQPGSTDPDVQVVQTALRNLGYNIDPTEDGTFGTSTQAAYKQFEISLGYTDDSGTTPPPSGSTVYLADVQYGMENDEVVTVQTALINQGFDIPAGATGYFGDQTLSAYSAYQQSLGYSGADADGNPGCTSLTELGSREGFTVECTGSASGGGGGGTTGTANDPQYGAISISSVGYTKNSGITNSFSVAQGYAFQAAEKTGVGDSWVTGVSNGCNMMTLIQRESSYDDNAVNAYDSNAWGPIQADGNPLHCSRGYCQTIPDTFAAYHEEGTANRIYDPVANICASINYIRDVYGGIENVQQANPNMSPYPY